PTPVPALAVGDPAVLGRRGVAAETGVRAVGFGGGHRWCGRRRRPDVVVVAALGGPRCRCVAAASAAASPAGGPDRDRVLTCYRRAVRVIRCWWPRLPPVATRTVSGLRSTTVTVSSASTSVS